MLPPTRIKAKSKLGCPPLHLRPPLLKHQRYPLGKPEDKRMTIAAGFVCIDGVLLCADTEQTEWAMKLYSSKITHFKFPGGQLAYALTGNTKLGYSAIQKCRKKLEAGVKGDPLSHIEKILDSEYRRVVFKHPDYPKDKSGIEYGFMLALSLEGAPFTLYETVETTIHRVDQYDCIGFGNYLAHYFVRPSYATGITIRKLLPLVVYTLACTKGYVPGCGGISVYLLALNDGRVGVLTSHDHGVCENVEKFAKAYDLANQELLFALASTESTDEQFESYLRTFWVERIMQTRRRWTIEWKQREENFAHINPHLTPDQAKLAYLQLSMGLIPDLPTPEPPGAADELSK
jgi:hypothetical protein